MTLGIAVATKSLEHGMTVVEMVVQNASQISEH